MSVALEACQAALDDLLASSDVDAAMIVRRDGISAANAGRSIDHEVLGAMAAAAAGAADVCSQTAGASAMERLDVRTGQASLSILSLDQEYILVAIAPDAAALDKAQSAMDGARQAVQSQLARA